MEMKMGTLLKVSLLLVVAATPIRSTSKEVPASEERETKVEAVPADDTHDTPELSTPKSTNHETSAIGARGTVKYSGPEPSRPEKAGRPFFYGRRFELPKDTKNNDGKDELYSPLITNPIRALLSNSTTPDEEAVKQNQNEIFTNIRDFVTGETTEGSFGKHSSQQDSMDDGVETTRTAPSEEFHVEVNGSRSKSRQDGDRSLMVVLPFKAEGSNVEELFTKSPMVKVIENDELETREGTTPTAVTREREIISTTEQQLFVTRKRWRPYQRYRTTTEANTPKTTTENGEDVTKTYTTYDDAEMVTRKFENFPQYLVNHKYDTDYATPNPIYKRFGNKTKKDHPEPEEREENSTTEQAVPLSSTEKPREVKPKLKRKGQRRKPTTEGPPKPEELAKILDILPVDVKDLILQMGLNKESKDQEASRNNFRLERPPQPIIDPMSYAVFKPLPLEGQNENRNFVPDDMRDFLASFGLLPVGGRVQKSMKVETPPSQRKPVEDLSGVNLDFLPDDLKSLLEDMGLVKSENKKEPTRIHIFNPSNHSIAHSEEDFEKLNAILSSIKSTVNKSQSLTPEMQSEIIEKIKDLNNLRYRNGNLSEINNEIKKIVVDNKASNDTRHRVTAKRATKLNEGPDPLMFSEESLLKNDVKRQENSANSSSASSSASSFSSSDASGSSSASSSASSAASGDASASASSASGSEGEEQVTTEEAPNIEALKESFGGGETASDDEDVESSLPPKRPNGLYLLLDWNSFLEVGTDDDSRRVNLRFQPKIGDSRNFLPVSVP